MNEELKQLGGGLDSPEDPRDILAEEVAGAVKMPEEFFSPYAVEAILKNGVNNQGGTGSCVAQAADKCNEAMQQYVGLGVKDFSPRFIYSLARKDDGLSPSVFGTYLYMAGKILRKYGSAEESVYPSDHTLLENAYKKDETTIRSYENAQEFKIEGYGYTTRTLDGYRKGIWSSTGNVIVGGYPLGGNMGIQPQRVPQRSQWNGGHANCFFGFDKDHVYAIGSWTENYGATLYLKKTKSEFGEIWVKGTKEDHEVILKGIHIINREWETLGALYRGITFFDKKFSSELQERIMQLKLIKLEGKEEVYAVLKQSKYWVTPGGNPNTIYEEGRGVLWPDVPPDKVLEVNQAEFDSYNSKGIFGGTLMDAIRFFFMK